MAGDGAPDGPRLMPAGEARCGVHGTAVALDGRGLLITGPAGAGKSGTAAQLLALGGSLVADDLVMVEREEGGLVLLPPPDALPAIELRGFGIIPIRITRRAPLQGILWLGPSPARLPEAQSLDVLGWSVPLLRHPADAVLAAKALLWLRSR